MKKILLLFFFVLLLAGCVNDDLADLKTPDSSTAQPAIAVDHCTGSSEVSLLFRRLVYQLTRKVWSLLFWL